MFMWMLTYKKILCISSLKLSFRKMDTGGNISPQAVIFIEHIHHWKGICRILFSRHLPFGISLHCRLITSNWTLGGSSSIAQLSGFQNIEISFTHIKIWKMLLGLQFEFRKHICCKFVWSGDFLLLALTVQKVYISLILLVLQTLSSKWLFQI